MKKRLNQYLCELKSIIIRCLKLKDGKLQPERMIQELLSQLKDMMHADEITFYQYNEVKCHLQYKISSDLKRNGHEIDVVAITESLERELKVQDYLVCSLLADGLQEYALIVPLKVNEKVIGILALKEKGKTLDVSLDSSFYQILSAECSNLIQIATSISRIVEDERRHKQLFRVTEKFHSSMNTEEVLREMIRTLKAVFPDFIYYLLLSNDNEQHSDLPIKDLEYDSENIAAMQAYVTGTSQYEDLMSGESALYAPLKGKQGVYGVLQVISPFTMAFSKDEMEFVALLANTAGGAIENAQLYLQSKRLIADLQLINETSHRLNLDLRLTETITYMKNQIVKSFDAQEIGFFHKVKNGQFKVLPGSSEFFTVDEGAGDINIIKEKMFRAKEAIFLGDFKLDSGYSSCYRSVMAVPMARSKNITGFVIILHSESYHFTFETFKLLQSLIHHSTLAFANSMLREELETMVVTDHLTGLYSRSYLDEKLNESMNKEKEGVFILIDIDNFKDINDTYGHQTGDDILQQVSAIIQKNIRSTDIAARWGGEELAIYLPRVPIKIGKSIAERIRARVEGKTVPAVTISCGISYWNTTQADTSKELFKRADTVLYEAKNSGKNKVLLGLLPVEDKGES
ncbi:MAG: diguanylate cyclase domain-containing protein [Bacillus sp. (in: firmicutes)]